MNPGVTPSFERIILKCTEKKPEDRYKNAAEVISDLRRALLNADDPQVGAEILKEDPLSETRPISRKELDLIKTRSDGQQGTEKSPGIPGSGERPDRTMKKIRPGRSRRAVAAGRKPHPASRTRTARPPRWKKVLTGLGVVAALLVVVVGSVFFSLAGRPVHQPIRQRGPQRPRPPVRRRRTESGKPNLKRKRRPPCPRRR